MEWWAWLVILVILVVVTVLAVLWLQAHRRQGGVISTRGPVHSGSTHGRAGPGGGS